MIAHLTFNLIGDEPIERLIETRTFARPHDAVALYHAHEWRECYCESVAFVGAPGGNDIQFVIYVEVVRDALTVDEQHHHNHQETD